MQAGESLQDQMSLFRTWYTPQRRPTLINRSLAQKKQDFVGSFIDSRTTPCPSIYCEGQSRARVGQYASTYVEWSERATPPQRQPKIAALSPATTPGLRDLASRLPQSQPSPFVSFALHSTSCRVSFLHPAFGRVAFIRNLFFFSRHRCPPARPLKSLAIPALAHGSRAAWLPSFRGGRRIGRISLAT